MLMLMNLIHITGSSQPSRHLMAKKLGIGWSTLTSVSLAAPGCAAPGAVALNCATHEATKSISGQRAGRGGLKSAMLVSRNVRSQVNCAVDDWGGCSKQK
jgi:hypothetical protein